MAAAMRGYRMKLIMPANQSQERRDAMAAYGAELISVSKEEGMEGARDLAQAMQARGEGRVLDQFANPDNPLAHYESTGPEIWRDTEGGVTHFVSSMGTTGTIMGCSMYLKEQNPAIQIIGLQPTEGSSIPGIRRWPKEYLPSIYDDSRVDRVIDMDQALAEHTMRRLAREEGISCGVSSGGAVAGALRLSEELENAVIVAIICDRGDRYLSTGVFQGAWSCPRHEFFVGNDACIVKKASAAHLSRCEHRFPQSFPQSGSMNSGELNERTGIRHRNHPRSGRRTPHLRSGWPQ
jgi:cysteine synthase B